AARFEGNSSDPDRCVHGLQPAWSLDVLWVPFREIAVYRSFARREVPLSVFTPQRSASQEGVGATPHGQIDRSALGSPLANAKLEFGWGFGVVGGTALEFDLHPAARFFRT